MSAQVNLVAFDGATTPVIHTLIPMGVTKEAGATTAEWAERLASIPLNAQVTVTTRERTLKDGRNQVSASTSVSVMESVSGPNAAGYTAAPAIAFTDVIVTTGYFSPRSPTVQRRLVRQMHVNSLNGVSTTVAPVTTGPIPELFDQQINPS